MPRRSSFDASSRVGAGQLPVVRDGFGAGVQRAGAVSGCGLLHRKVVQRGGEVGEVGGGAGAGQLAAVSCAGQRHGEVHLGLVRVPRLLYFGAVLGPLLALDLYISAGCRPSSGGPAMGSSRGTNSNSSGHYSDSLHSVRPKREAIMVKSTGRNHRVRTMPIRGTACGQPVGSELLQMLTSRPPLDTMTRLCDGLYKASHMCSTCGT